MSEELFQAMAKSIIEGDPDLARGLAVNAISQGIDPMQAINRGFVPGVDHVGQQFSCGDMFLPELVIAGEAMKAALAILEPELARLGTERQVLGKVVLGTIQGDIHDIGKTLVGTMLAANGFQVYDLGVDVAIPDILAKAEEVGADIIAVSALLTTTMVNQRALMEALVAADVRGKYKVMVGGAPVTQSWVDEIGADGYSEDAVGAVQAAKTLLGK